METKDLSRSQIVDCGFALFPTFRQESIRIIFICMAHCFDNVNVNTLNYF